MAGTAKAHAPSLPNAVMVWQGGDDCANAAAGMDGGCHHFCLSRTCLNSGLGCETRVLWCAELAVGETVAAMHVGHVPP
jgi:L-arabinose isomerase